MMRPRRFPLSLGLTPVLAVALAIILACAHSPQAEVAVKTNRPSPQATRGGEPGAVRVAILKDRLGALEPGQVESLASSLRQQGLDVETLDGDALADPAALSAQNFDCLVMTNSPDFPQLAKANFQDFLKGGGDVVLLGGHPFVNPLRKAGGSWRPTDLSEFKGEWLTRGEILARVALDAQPLKPLLDFERGSLNDWKRSASDGTTPTRLTFDQGPTGRALRMDIKTLTGWDMQGVAIKGKVPGGHNVLSFWAKGDAQTPQLVIEAHETDGSRWVKTVNLSPEWHRYAVAEQDFGFLDGGTVKKPRGGVNDRLKLRNTQRLAFGLAFGISRQNRGDHTVWVGDVATARTRFPKHLGPVEQPVFAPICDYIPSPVKGIATVTSAGPRNRRAGASEPEQTLTGPFDGYEIIGFNVSGQSAFIPMFKAKAADGEDLGCIGGLTVHYGGPYAGSNWFVSGITTPGFYQFSDQAYVTRLGKLIRSMSGTRWAERARRRHERVEAERAKYPAFNYVISTQTFSPTYQFTAKTRLLETAEAIRDLGASSVKLDLGPGSIANYKLPPNPRIKTLRDLAELEPSYREVLAMPFRDYLLWTYPMCWTDKWRTKGFSEKQKEREYKEIYDLACYLLKTYSGTGKTFYLGHWEGDWMLLGHFNDTKDPSDKAVAGMIEWLNLRQRAVDDARRDAPHSDVRIYHYTEVTAVRKAMRGGKTLTNNVLPKTNVDLVSYSSYDSLSAGEGFAAIGPRLKESLDFLESKLPPKTLPDFEGRRVMLGEYGFPLKKTREILAQDVASRVVMATALEWGCPFVLYWEMYDNEAQEGGTNASGFWLIDNQGLRQPVYLSHYRFLERARRYVDGYHREHGRNPTQAEYRAAAVPWLREPN